MRRLVLAVSFVALGLLVAQAVATADAGADAKSNDAKPAEIKPGDAAKIDFETSIQPLLEAACLRCHNDKTTESEFRLDTRDAAFKGGLMGVDIVPGKPDKSLLYTMTMLQDGDHELMPPEGDRLDRSQTELIKTWIEQGAVWPANVKLQIQPRIEFAKHIQPILEQNCVACHQTGHAEGNLDLTTRKSALATGEHKPAIAPFLAKQSPVYTHTILGKNDERLMPPAGKGGPLDKSITEQLRLWIAQGAIWPENISLKVREKADLGPPTPDTMQLVERIRERIIAESKKSASAKMENYSSKVPRTGADYHMIAIAGGEFLMGSPQGEKDRQEIEGPQQKIKIDPFWMGKYEVTWDEYEPFMITKVDRFKNGARQDFDPKKHDLIDAVSQPTKPYVEMSFGMGQHGFPAISMTEHAANKYCQWLSAQTGHFYRLPTEAEWEYACRAGTTTAYSFGDDPAKLGEYAWYYDNSNEKYQKVGLKKPNPWGLYDMHGNVMEWTADQFLPDRFSIKPAVTDNPFIKPDKLYPRTVKGGSWDDDPDKLRSAARRGSDPSWKAQDPQLPKSIWYHTDAKGLGFRIVRPAKIPTAEEMYFYWNSAVGKL